MRFRFFIVLELPAAVPAKWLRTQRICNGVGRGNIWRWSFGRFERSDSCLDVIHCRAQRRRLLQICPGLLQRALKLGQRGGQRAGLHQDLNGGKPLGIDLRENSVIDRSRSERRVTRH